MSDITHCSSSYNVYHWTFLKKMLTDSAAIYNQTIDWLKKLVKDRYTQNYMLSVCRLFSVIRKWILHCIAYNILHRLKIKLAKYYRLIVLLFWLFAAVWLLIISIEKEISSKIKYDEIKDIFAHESLRKSWISQNVISWYLLTFCCNEYNWNAIGCYLLRRLYLYDKIMLNNEL